MGKKTIVYLPGQGRNMSIAFILLCFWFYNKNSEKCLVNACSKAIILWVALAYFSLEILSIFNKVTFSALVFFWGSINILLLIDAILECIKLKSGKVFVLQIVNVFKKNMIWVVLFIGLFYLALKTVPYNWDSMTYHLSRIANWAQNRSVAHYSTHNIREIVSPVLAEFVNLHVYILSGKRDYLFNFLQCFSTLMNTWLIYEISRKIGCGRRYAYMAAFLFFSAPSIFGEALSTHVDQFATLWLYYYTELMQEDCLHNDKNTIQNCVIMAICIAFGYLAKPSVLIGMALLLVVLLVQCIKRKDSLIIIGKLLLWVIPSMFLFLLPEFYRNLQSFSALTLPIAGQRQLVGTFKPLYVLVNGIKNLSFNLPNIYLYESDYWIAAIVYRIAGLLGVPIDDPSISEDGRAFYLHEAQTYEPDMAVNAVLLLAFLLCFIWGIFRIKKQTNSYAKKYSMIVAVIFIIFCCLVRWEPYVSRYMISYLALLCPMIAYETEDFSKNFSLPMGRAFLFPVILFMCCIELFGLSVYHTKISMYGSDGRFKGYFYNRQEIYSDYDEVCNIVISKGYKTVGLVLSGDSYEYPIWQRLNGSVELINHVMVVNESAQYEERDFIPECIISTKVMGDEIEYNKSVYKQNAISKGNSELWLYEINREKW